MTLENRLNDLEKLANNSKACGDKPGIVLILPGPNPRKPTEAEEVEALKVFRQKYAKSASFISLRWSGTGYVYEDLLPPEQLAKLW